MASSTRSTLTVISSPGATISWGLVVRDQPISDTWSSPWTFPAEVDEGAKVQHRGNAAGQHGAGNDRPADLRGVRLLLFLEDLSP